MDELTIVLPLIVCVFGIPALCPAIRKFITNDGLEVSHIDAAVPVLLFSFLCIGVMVILLTSM